MAILYTPEFVPPDEAVALLEDPAFSEQVGINTTLGEADRAIYRIEAALARRVGAVSAEGNPLHAFGTRTSVVEIMEDKRMREQTTIPKEIYAYFTPETEQIEAHLILPLLRNKALLTKAIYSVKQQRLRNGTAQTKLSRSTKSTKIDNPFATVTDPTSGPKGKITGDAIMRKSLHSGRLGATKF